MFQSNKKFIMDSAVDAAQMFIDFPYVLYLFIRAILSSVHKSFSVKVKSLENEIILVTGAASGLGREVVFKLAKVSIENRTHDKVVFVLWDVNEKGLNETKEKCRELGVNSVHIYVVDLTKREKIAECAESVRKNVGNVTLLYNNAGIAYFKKFMDADPILEENVIKVNLLSYVWIIREFLPGMLENGKGHLVCTCSGLAFYRFSHISSYCASKYGLRGFLESLKLEMRLMNPENPNTIKFSTIYPGFVKTPLASPVSWEKRYNILTILKFYEPEWVAGEIVDGILKEKEDIFVPRLVWWGQWLYRILPNEFVDKYEKFTIRNLRFAD